MQPSFGLLHLVHLSPHNSLAGHGHRLACLPIALPNFSFRAEWSKFIGGQARVHNAESNNSSNPPLIRKYPIAPSNPSSVYMSMSVTDSYTQSQTRLQTSVTELNVATAHWRRNAANAHLAAERARTGVFAGECPTALAIYQINCFLFG